MPGRTLPPAHSIVATGPGRLRALALALLAGLFPSVPAQAAPLSATFMWAQSPIGSGLIQPNGMAVDGQGAVYIADPGHARVVKETPAADGRFTQTEVYNESIAAHPSQPKGVAVDGQGHVFVADYANGRVMMATWNPVNQDYTLSDVLTGLGHPWGVAVDATGDLFVAGMDLANASYVKKAVSPSGSGGSWTVSDYITSGTTPVNPAGLGLDSGGTLYIADRNGHAVLQVDGTGRSSPLVTGLSGPTAVAVTATAAYIADEAGNKIMKFQGGTLSTVAQGLAAPAGVAAAAGAAGDLVFYANTTTNNVFGILPANPFGMVKVGSASTPPISFAFRITSGGTMGNPPQVSVQGASGPSQEFRDAQTGTVIVGGSYNAEDIAIVDVTFNPARPGVRYGAVQLMDGGSPSRPLATAYIQGIGTGPQVAFPGANPATEPITGLVSPRGVAVGADGSIYVAEQDPLGSQGRVVKGTPDGNGGWTSSLVVTGLSATPYAVAVDGAGTLYFTDQGGNLFRATPAGANYALDPVALVTGLDPATAVAVDGTGAIYLTDPANANVTRRYLDAGAPPPVGLVGPIPFGTLQSPTALALAQDGSGDLFVGDQGGQVWRVPVLPAGNGPAAFLYANGSDAITGLAADAAGGIYAVQGTAASANTWPMPVAQGLSSGLGLALDTAGNVYITDTLASKLYRYDVATAPSLAFGDVPVGTTSSSPVTLRVMNNGNRDLTFAAPVLAGATNPGFQPARYGLDPSSPFQPIPDGGASVTLAADNTATFAVVFSPQRIGSDPGSMALADDHLNLAGSSQSVSLAGNGTVGTATINLANQTKPYTGSPVPVDYSVAPAGAPVTVSYTGTSVLYPPTSNPPTQLGAYAVTIAVAGPDYQGQPATGTLTIGPGVVSVNLDAAALQNQVYTTQPHPVAASTTPAGVATSVTYSGTTAAGAGYPASPEPPVEAGTYTVTATTTDGNYQVASDTQMLVIAKAPAVVTPVQADLQDQVYNGQPHPVGFTTTPSLPLGSVTVTYGSIGIELAGRRSLAAASGPPVDAGQYPVRATVHHPNYTGTAQATLAIAAAPATVTLDPATLTQAFTGSPLAVGYTVVPATAPVSLTYAGAGLPPTAQAPSAAGSYTVVAAITGPNYTGASATGTFRITAATPAASPTTMELTVNKNPLQAYDSVSILASVTGTGQQRPTGTVTFTLEGTALGSAVLEPSTVPLMSVARLNLDAWSAGAGSHTIAGAYAGDTGNAGSTASINLTVNPLPPLTLTGPDGEGKPLSVTVTADGKPGTCSFNVQSGGDPYASSVTFSVLGGPPGATLTFSPTIVTPNTYRLPVTIYVKVPPERQIVKRNADGPIALPTRRGAAGVFLACGLMAIPWSRRSRRRSRLWTGLALLLAVGLLGCWSRNPKSTVYHASVVVTAANARAGTAPVATIPLDVTVQQ